MLSDLVRCCSARFAAFLIFLHAAAYKLPLLHYSSFNRLESFYLTMPVFTPPSLSVAYRGRKVELLLDPAITLGAIKRRILEESCTDDTSLNLRLVFKGKQLVDDDESMLEILQKIAVKNHYKLVATGVSAKEQEQFDAELQSAQRNLRIRDDLTHQGQGALQRRQRLGQHLLVKAAAKRTIADSNKYGFGRIQVLPNLPDHDQARLILQTLANDPGVMACMRQHQWHVPMLSEIYPHGKVGESDVCVMGLNKNNGQEILLRIRTDDLKGFRKLASIRQVLYHELAHNVHSDHGKDFFQLMRQVERECTSLDWTRGAGVSSLPVGGVNLYEAGTYRLGGGSTEAATPLRELAAQAAIERMTKEEEEIQEHCGCGRQDLLLPKTADGNSSDHS
jgi:hypothetical protein